MLGRQSVGETLLLPVELVEDSEEDQGGGRLNFTLGTPLGGVLLHVDGEDSDKDQGAGKLK